ncbi:MAG: protein kinase [Deltaproteobacteria bacterium]|nr:protein kinase [Deltaproteobacteria bacterium]
MIADHDPVRAELGRYQLLERIGEGGMAEVFLARDTGTLGLDRLVAIKLVHRELALENGMATMLLDEARLAARIAHPNVSSVIDLGESGGVPYLVMEYLRGHSLSAVIRRAIAVDTQPDLHLMCRIVADAAEGAHAAHQVRGPDGRNVGLVHRDLSPHNIFVTFDGSVKVMDFGVAKAVGRSTRTAPGTRKGKFSYMAPEQLRGEALDRRTDVYALGLVLYEATTGKPAFGGPAALDLGARVRSFESPSKIRKGYPKALEAIVMRAAASSPDDRYPTARELGQALEELVVGSGALTDPARVAAMMGRLFVAGDSGGGAEADTPVSVPTAIDPRTPKVSPIGSGTLAPNAILSGLPYSALDRPPNVPLAETRFDRRPPARNPARMAGRRRAGMVLVLALAACGIASWVISGTPIDRRDAPRAAESSAESERRAEAEPRAAEPLPREAAEPPPRDVAAPLPREAAAPLPREAAAPPPREAAEPPPREVAAPAPLADPPARSVLGRGPSSADGTRPAGRRRAVAESSPKGSEGEGTLDVRSDPWSHVYVDGHLVRATPIVGLSLRAGPHSVRLVAADGREKSTRVTISGGRSSTVDVEF